MTSSFSTSAERAPTGSGSLWIVHRDGVRRASLARLAGAGESTVLAAPPDDSLASLGTPTAILLAPSGDFEQELDFAHRFQMRHPDARWVLVCERGDQLDVERLFAGLGASVLAYPPPAPVLQRALQADEGRRAAAPLAWRRERDRVATRFARWFADLELPELLRALDPHLQNLPVLICGEAGSGRGILARYIHTFGEGKGGEARGPLVELTCDPSTTVAALLRGIAETAPEEPGIGWTLCLEDVDQLSPAVQRRIRSWLDFGLSGELSSRTPKRWVLTASDAHDPERDELLEASLLRAVGPLTIRVPPLRERTDAIAPLVSETALQWANAHGGRLRQFSEECLAVLRDHPWPGNTAELEAAIERTLARSNADPVQSHHLCLEGVAVLELGDPPRPDPPRPSPGLSDSAQSRSRQSPAESSAVQPPADPLEPRARPRASHSAQDEGAWRRLVAAVSHEIRNPLTSIRTFAEMLPEHFDDPEFRERFTALVDGDVRRIEGVVAQLQEMSDDSRAQHKPVDVAAMLEELLDERRDLIRSRNLLVLRELDRGQPFVLADPVQLRAAFAGLLDRSLELVPERGDVYLASRHHAGGASDPAAVRILLRFHGGSRDRAPSVEGVSEVEASVHFALAEAVVRAHGGSLTLDTSDPHETVVVIDLPAPD